MTDRIIQYVAIALPVSGGNGVFNMSVAGSVESVIAELDAARSESRGARFLNAFDESLVCVVPHEILTRVVGIYENRVTVTDDPRKAGQQQTPGGIYLPPPAMPIDGRD